MKESNADVIMLLFVQVTGTIFLIIVISWVLGFFIGFVTPAEEGEDVCKPNRIISKSFLGWGYQFSCPRK